MATKYKKVSQDSLDEVDARMAKAGLTICALSKTLTERVDTLNALIDSVNKTCDGYWHKNNRLSLWLALSVVLNATLVVAWLVAAGVLG